MKVTFELPEEFQDEFLKDGFEESLSRLCSDAHLVAGNFEKETAKMLINAFKESKISLSLPETNVFKDKEELR